MSRLGNAIAIIGAGVGGYMQGQRMKQQAEADREDREFQRSQRMRMLDQQARDDSLRQEVSTAASGDAPRSARHEAVAGAYEKAGRLDEAERYRALARQAREEGVLELVDAIRASAPDVEAVRGTKAGFVSHEVPADALAKFDGVGKWKLPQGAVAQSFIARDRYGNEQLDQRIVLPDGRVLLPSLGTAAKFIGMTAAQRREAEDRDAATDYAVRTKERDYTDGRKDKEREFGLKEREAAGNDMLRRAQAGYYSQRGDAAARGGAGATQPAPVWDDKADAFLRTRYTVTDPTTGETVVDGQGLQFAKVIALAEAKRNGGDTTRALGYAFEADAKIKAMAGGDPAKIAAARSKLLADATAPKAPPEPAAPVTPPAGERGPTRAAAARMGQPVPAAAPAATSAAPQTPAARQDFGSQALNDIVAAKAERVAAAQAALLQAQQQLAAAGKSGDAQAINHYAAIVQQASAALEAASR